MPLVSLERETSYMSAFDDQMVQMFQTMVLPTMKQMPTPQLKQIQEYLNEQIGEELARREAEGEPVPPTPEEIQAELQRRGISDAV